MNHQVNHLDTHNIIFKHQYGFRSRQSCETQLLIIIDYIAKAVNNRKQVGACMLDFSKAFDKVPHAPMPTSYANLNSMALMVALLHGLLNSY